MFSSHGVLIDVLSVDDADEPFRVEGESSSNDRLLQGVLSVAGVLVLRRRRTVAEVNVVAADEGGFGKEPLQACRGVSGHSIISLFHPTTFRPSTSSRRGLPDRHIDEDLVMIMVLVI